jgi:hypothetical protein
MTSLALILRSSSGLRLIWMRPLLSVVLVPSTPMNDERLSTPGLEDHLGQRLLALRHRIEETTGLRRFGDAQDHARVLHGKKPLGTMM